MSKRTNPTPPLRLIQSPATEPRWQDLPSHQQEELLRHLGRMLAERLTVPDATAEGTHER